MRSSAQKRWSSIAAAVWWFRELSRVQRDCPGDGNHENMDDVECAENLLSPPSPPIDASDESISSSPASFHTAPDAPVTNSHASPPADRRLSFQTVDIESRQNRPLLSEPTPSSHASLFKKSLPWFFPIATLLLEVLSEVFNQLSSKRRPYLGLVSMLMSFATLLVCIIELVHRGCKEKVVWKKKGMMIYWFFHPNDSGSPFGTYADVEALICSMLQCVFASIAYAFLANHANDPIRASYLPIVLAVGLLYSTYNQQKNNSGTVAEPGRGQGPENPQG